METLFAAVNLAILPFWLLMIFAPRWKLARRVMASPLSIAWMPVLYTGLVIPRVDMLLPLLTSPLALEPVAMLLGSPDGAVIGWIHILAFDLFVGRWVYLDAQTRQTAWRVSSPILILTLLFGPMGLLAYLLVRPADQVGGVVDEKRVRPPDGPSAL